MSVAEDRVRIDIGAQSTIFRVDRGQWIRIDGARGRVVTAALPGSGGTAGYPDWIPALPIDGGIRAGGGASWRETGADSTIAGMPTRHLVREEAGGVVREIWVTREGIGGGLYYRALERALAGAWGVSAPAGHVLPEGVPLRELTTVATRDGIVVVSDIEATVESDAFLAAGVFEAPDGSPIARSSPRHRRP